jgi:8-oxo-dGTP pyrophosphatase MutT (NUDIX family)
VVTGPVSSAPPLFSVRSSRRVFDGAVTALRIDEVMMPDGQTALREVVEHDLAVAVVALDTGEDTADDTAGTVGPPAPAAGIILIEQYRHPLRRRLWELPAGLMDVDDEPAQQAAARELIEETGYVAAEWSVLLDVATSPGFSEEVVRIFLARGLTRVGRPRPGQHEEAELRVVRVPLDTAVRAVLDGRIVNVMAVAGILAAERTLREGPVARRVDPSAGDLPWPAHTEPEVPQAPPLEGSQDR